MNYIGENKLNIKITAIEPYTLYVSIDDLNGIIKFDIEFLNRGSFFQPLLDFDFFKQAFVNMEDGLIEWPNSFGIAIDEIIYGLQNSKTNVILIG
jgi:hypothetical protein